MKILATALSLLALAALAPACKGDEASCDKVVEHTLSLIPDGMKGQLPDKSKMIEKCKEQPEAVRKCAMAAESFADLAACSKKK